MFWTEDPSGFTVLNTGDVDHDDLGPLPGSSCGQARRGDVIISSDMTPSPGERLRTPIGLRSETWADTAARNEWSTIIHGSGGEHSCQARPGHVDRPAVTLNYGNRFVGCRAAMGNSGGHVDREAPPGAELDGAHIPSQGPLSFGWFLGQFPGWVR